MKILVIEDDLILAKSISNYLEKRGNKVDILTNIPIYNPKTIKQELIILDLNLNGIKSGIPFLKNIRKNNKHLPIIIVSAENDIYTKIELLNSGASDYITKPFHIEELEARIKIAMKNKQNKPRAQQKINQNYFYWDENEVKLKNGRKIHLTKKEKELLEFLAAEKTVKNEEEIAKEIWGYTGKTYSNIIPATIKRIRKKFAPNSVIETIRGVGYRIEST